MDADLPGILQNMAYDVHLHNLPSIPIKYSKTSPFCKQKIKS